MKTLLFVDDDGPFRELFRRVFEEEGYRVVLAQCGAEGVEVVTAECPDVAILDVRMPEMDGLDLAEQLRMIAPRLPIILYTGCDEMCTMDCRAGLAAACVDKIRASRSWRSPSRGSCRPPGTPIYSDKACRRCGLLRREQNGWKAGPSRMPNRKNREKRPLSGKIVKFRGFSAFYGLHFSSQRL